MQLHESLKTARIKYKDKIDLDIFKQFINADKSKSYKYVEKMCEIFHNYNITYLNVIKIFSYLWRVLFTKQNIRHTYNGIHRRSDFVGHCR